MHKLDSTGYDTDKGKSYIRFYEKFFSANRLSKINFLELGVHRGGSLLMWRDYFVNGTIVGVDLKAPPMPHLDRLYVFSGDASDRQTYTSIERSTGIKQFDIIIDDASHYGILTKKSFEALFVERLKPGGIYVFEDWGTSYLAGWPDGRKFEPHKSIQGDGVHDYEFPSHSHGMAGYIKQLIDVCAAPDIVAGGGQIGKLPIDSITCCHGLTFILKLPL